jgi:hypothetical protein
LQVPPASVAFPLVLFQQLLLKVSEAHGFVGIKTIRRTKIKIETPPFFIMDVKIF